MLLLSEQQRVPGLCESFLECGERSANTNGRIREVRAVQVPVIPAIRYLYLGQRSRASKGEEMKSCFGACFGSAARTGVKVSRVASISAILSKQHKDAMLSAVALQQQQIQKKKDLYEESSYPLTHICK